MFGYPLELRIKFCGCEQSLMTNQCRDGGVYEDKPNPPALKWKLTEAHCDTQLNYSKERTVLLIHSMKSPSINCAAVNMNKLQPYLFDFRWCLSQRVLSMNE